MQVARRGAVAAVVAVVAVVLVRPVTVPAQGEVSTCRTSGSGVVAAENRLPGTPPGAWLSTAQHGTIEGFADASSVNCGQSIGFKISTPARAYHLAIYRIGYYGGLGARLIAKVKPSVRLPQSQPPCLTDHTTRLVDCGNWAVSARWDVPATAVSGVYVADLVRDDAATDQFQVLFVVRNDNRASDVLYQTSDETWQAYNNWGSESLYRGTGGPGLAGRAYKVSYNRPLNDLWAFYLPEYPMIRWLEAQGYDVSYLSDVDTDRYGATLLGSHHVFLDVGHDEYVTPGQRANIAAARGAGVNLAFFSGNEVYWESRFEPSINSTRDPYRTLVCYKEPQVTDPTPSWTGRWMDPAGKAKGGFFPQNELSGQLMGVIGGHAALEVPAVYAPLRLWRNTAVAKLPPGAVATLGQGIVGYEFDLDIDNGYRPPGLIDLSATTVSGVEVFVADFLNPADMWWKVGSATHHLTMYRDQSSGALVFGAGTIQWAWGLDDNHPTPQPTRDLSIEQATVNVLADMNAQPATLQTGLVPALASTDRTPPTTAIASPLPASQLPLNTAVTISGSAVDTDGVVAGVEVSVDAGTTWHQAVGTAQWSYTWTPTAVGNITIEVRAVDDSGNLQHPPTMLPAAVLTSSPA